MKPLLLTLIVFFISVFELFGQTEVSGAITSDTEWTIEGSPYLITGNTLVSENTTLTIYPGVTIKASPNTYLRVDGTLNSQGSSTNKIIFESTTSTGKSEWSGIRIRPTSQTVIDGDKKYVSGSKIEHTIIKNADIGVYIYDTGIFISNTEIFNNRYGIELRKTTGVVLDKLYVHNNSNGIWSEYETFSPNDTTGHIVDTQITSSTFSNNNIGIDLIINQRNFEDLVIRNNKINNNGIGIDFSGGGYGCRVKSVDIFDNIIIDNTTGIQVGQIYGYGGSFFESESVGVVPMKVYRNIIVNNPVNWYYGGGISGVTTKISNNIIYNPFNGDPNSNDTAGAYTNGLFFTGGTSRNDTISNNLIVSNRVSINLQDSYTDPSNKRFLNNTIIGEPTLSDHIISLYGQGHIFKNNNIRTFEGKISIKTTGADAVNAENNYWFINEDDNLQNYVYDFNDDFELGLIDVDPALSNINIDSPITPPFNVTKSVTSGGVLLAWSANPESDIAGYKLHYGSPTGYSYENTVDLGNVTSYTISGGNIDTEYAITAYDSDADGTDDQVEGYQSWFSVARELTVSLSTNETSMNEDGGSITLTGTLDYKSSQDVTIDLGFFGTAIHGTDFSSNETLTISAGSLTGSITLNATQDTNVELDKTIIIDIDGVVGATEATEQQVSLTLIDDDLPTINSVIASNEAISENGGETNITATISDVTSKTVSLPVTFTGTSANNDFTVLPSADYTLMTSQITIQSGETTGSILITGTIDGNQEGNETVIVTTGSPTNGVLDEQEVITISIVDYNPSAEDQTVSATEQVEKEITLVGQGVDLTYSISTEPSNGTVSLEGNIATYVSNSDSATSDSFGFKVTDANLDLISAEGTVTINITGVNDAPVSSNGTSSGAEETDQEITLSSADPESQGLEYTIVTETSNGEITLENNIATYTPDENFFGEDSFSFKTSDGALFSNIAEVTITVTNVNDAPTTSNGTLTTSEDTQKAISLVANDVDGDDLVYTVVNSPTKGTLSISDLGEAIYVPSSNLFGSDSFTFKVNDGVLDSNTSAVSITISAVNDTPIATSQEVVVVEQSEKEITLTGTDTEDSSLSYTITSIPLHGELFVIKGSEDHQSGGGTSSGGSESTDDSETYVKILSEDLPVLMTDSTVKYLNTSNSALEDSFKFRVSDGGLNSNESTVTLIITPVNDTPTDLALNSNSVEENAADSIVGTFNTTDPDAEDTFTYELVSGEGSSSNELFKISGSQLLTASSLDFEEKSNHSIRVKVTDSGDSSFEKVLTINVIDLNDIQITPTITNTYCEGDSGTGSIIVAISDTSGELEYDWSGPGDFTANTRDIFNLSSGTYTLTITDEVHSKSTEVNISLVEIFNDLEICYVTSDTQDFKKNRVFLSYSGIYNDSSYEVLREGAQAGVYEVIGEIEAGETSFLDEDSNNTSKVYSYKVRMKDNCGNFSDQSANHKTILLQSSIATDNSVNLSWNDYTGRSYSSYLIYRSVNDGSFEQIAAISSSNNTYNDTEADIAANAYTYYIAIEISSCATTTANPAVGSNKLPEISLETESIQEIQSNRKEIATLNNPPTVQPVTFSTEEDTAVVITLSGTDEDGDTLSFNATEPQHGEVTISGASLTYTPETNYFGTDSFTYTANDGSLTSETASIEVSIAPINDTPELSSIEPVSFSEATETGTLITTLSASDIDSETVSFYLLGDSDNNFIIEGNTVLLNNPFDYESKEAVTVNIVASDGELTDTKDLVITVEDVPNNSVEQEYAITVYNVNNEDNTEKLDYTQWTNSTENTESGDFIFQISGGEDAALFTIDPVTGALDFIEAPDYENPSDANGDNVYIVIVKITNINDGAPEIPVVSSQTSVAVPESQTAAADVDAINTTNETDTDEDGVVDTEDNCPTTYNPGQEDMDDDGIGDVCDDSDMDTFFDAFDECPNSAYGVTVDAAGCEVFALPSNTFSVTVSSATCPDTSNGSITISTSNTDYSYRYAINNQTAVALGGNTQTIANLAAGVYTVCVTVDGVSDYERCYTIEITEPAQLVASSRIDVSSRNMQLDLSGASEYQVTLNGKTFLTTEDKLSLNLAPGMNRVEVATALDCQGVYFEEIFVSEAVKVYPNPTAGPLQLFVAGSDGEVELRVTTLSGNVVSTATLLVPANRIIETSLGNLPQGMYLITLSSTTVKTTHKIIKE